MRAETESDRKCASWVMFTHYSEWLQRTTLEMIMANSLPGRVVQFGIANIEQREGNRDP